MKLIHLTDLHIVAPGRLVCGRDPCANLAAAVDDINRHHADAAQVVISGDLVDDGSPAAYAALAGLIGRLIPPVRLMIGNHDDRAAFRAAFPDAPAEDGFVQSVEDCEAGRIVFLDTVDAGAVGGRLGPDRLAWLDRRLREAADRPALVFMHHPPFAIGMPPLDGIGLADADDFAALVLAAGNVRHIFAGHVHRLAAGRWRGIAFATGRGTNHQSAALFDAQGFADSAEAPAYNVVLITGEDVVVHAHEFPRPA